MLEIIGEIFDEIMKGFFRGIGFILSVLFFYFILFVVIGIKVFGI